MIGATILDGLAALVRAVTPGAALVFVVAALAWVAWRRGLRALVCPLVALAAFSGGYDLGYATALGLTGTTVFVMPATSVVLFGGLAWAIHRFAPMRR